MKIERRVCERFQVDLAVVWEGEKGRCDGAIQEISVAGCFVLGAGVVADGELVRLEIVLPKKKIIVLWGEVRNHLDEIGFGMKFTNLGLMETKWLKRMVERAEEQSRSG